MSVSLPLSQHMYNAYARQRSRGEGLLREYSGARDDAELDAFYDLVRDHFNSGVHAAIVHAIVRALIDKYGNQQAAAEALGLRHRTSITKMLRSETIEGKRLTCALNICRNYIEQPSPELCTLYGFSRATAYVKARTLRDANIEKKMTPQEFSLTLGILESDEWDSALRSRDPEEARRVAEKLVRERAIEVQWPRPPKRGRPPLRREQCVIALRRISDEWSPYAVVALTAIPDCIPEDEEGEVSL